MVNDRPKTLNVLMNGIAVGTLKKRQNDTLTFKYAASWLATPGARPISISMPLLNRPYQGEVVHAFFDALLPASETTRAQLKAQFKTKSTHPFDLLAEVGKECIGAIQLVPNRVPAVSRKIRFEPMSDKAIYRRLASPEKHPLGLSPGLDTFCHTLPGKSNKAAFLHHEGSFARPRDKTPTTHIFKLENKNKPYQIESTWLALQIAKAYGLEVAEANIKYFESIKALVIKRFDRTYSKDNSWLMRIPQESLKTALPSLEADKPIALKKVMQFLLGSNNPIYDRDILFCTHVLAWLIDAHSVTPDNLSIFILPEGKYRLAPLYDLCSKAPLGQADPATPPDFMKLAKQAQYSVERARLILNDMLARTNDVISEVQKALPHHFPKHVYESVFKAMETRRNQLTQAKAANAVPATHPA